MGRISVGLSLWKYGHNATRPAWSPGAPRHLGGPGRCPSTQRPLEAGPSPASGWPPPTVPTRAAACPVSLGFPGFRSESPTSGKPLGPHTPGWTVPLTLGFVCPVFGTAEAHELFAGTRCAPALARESVLGCHFSEPPFDGGRTSMRFSGAQAPSGLRGPQISAKCGGRGAGEGAGNIGSRADFYAQRKNCSLLGPQM